MKNILVTGAAGFIGFHLCRVMADREYSITALDNINNYYDPELKYGRLNELGFKKSAILENQIIQSGKYKNIEFIKTDLCSRAVLEKLFEDKKFDIVCNLAAQAGVQYSVSTPHTYIESNVTGFLNILECCRKNSIDKVLYASSSSVYGSNRKQPFSEKDRTDNPVSMYAATKKCNELMASVYNSLYRIKLIGLRFFTVYGPWGRPDMAYFKFAKKITENQSIDIYNNGKMKRDFTYIDDIIEGIIRILDRISSGISGLETAVYNIGRGNPENLLSFVEILERKLGKKADKKYLPFQIGDVEETFSDVSQLKKDFGYEPGTDLEEGLEKFINWFKNYYNL